MDEWYKKLPMRACRSCDELRTSLAIRETQVSAILEDNTALAEENAILREQNLLLAEANKNLHIACAEAEALVVSHAGRIAWLEQRLLQVISERKPLK